MATNRKWVEHEIIPNTITSGNWPFIERNGKFYDKKTGKVVKLKIQTLNQFLKENNVKRS